MTTERRPAEVFPPGDFLREELEERGWTQGDLAEIIGKNLRTVNDVVAGKRGISAETAHALGAALGTSAKFWMNLDAEYKVWKSRTVDSDAVTRRARIYSIAPVKDMIKRGWIESSESVDILEGQVLSFFGLSGMDETPSFGAHAARKSTAYESISPALQAWLFQCMHLSRHVQAAPYTSRNLPVVLNDLKPLMNSPQGARHVPRVLSESGIKLVIVEHLPKTKIDGATFWVEDSPVVALSLRYDRIDNFWFTLLHELGHVSQGQDSLDVEIEAAYEGMGMSLPAEEIEANEFAATRAIPQDKLESLMARVGPLYSSDRIRGFANLHGVHPGLVVGQLHKRGELNWSHLRKLLVPIRNHVINSATVDGWGSVFPSVTV